MDIRVRSHVEAILIKPSKTTTCPQIYKQETLVGYYKPLRFGALCYIAILQQELSNKGKKGKFGEVSLSVKMRNKLGTRRQFRE